MRNLNRREAQPATSKAYAILLTGLAALTLFGCGGDEQVGFNGDNPGTIRCQILKGKMKHLIAAVIS